MRRRVFEVAGRIGIEAERDDAFIVAGGIRNEVRRGGGEDRQVARRAVAAGRDGQSVGESEVAAVDLVADDALCEAERIAIAETGPGKGPMVGPADGVGGGATGDGVAEAGVAAATEAEAGQAVFRPADQRIGPDAGEEMPLVGRRHRIVAGAAEYLWQTMVRPSSS